MYSSIELLPLPFLFVSLPSLFIVRVQPTYLEEALCWGASRYPRVSHSQLHIWRCGTQVEIFAKRDIVKEAGTMVLGFSCIFEGSKRYAVSVVLYNTSLYRRVATGKSIPLTQVYIYDVTYMYVIDDKPENGRLQLPPPPPTPN